ncbi:phosphate acyltransferase PlsX [Clostridia bacterium OttesenSCG-928-F22]|nr:phosphate acyltransferase PlsX [Clostridia bacterium OttesenSCG-928-F22]
MKIVIDAFGGDNAPDVILEGSVAALKQAQGFELILTGDEAVLKQKLSAYEYDASRITIKHAPQVIGMHDSPVKAIKEKTESSLVVALKTVADKEADVVISAGSTGAVLSGATLIVRRIKGVKRPALAPVLPCRDGSGVLLIDCGANVDCKPAYLQQFGVMGSIYMKTVMGVEEPKVGLINNGAEEEKGNALTSTAHQLLKKSPIHFLGNIEGRDILSGEFDVAVADGFVGNVVLKFMEGFAKDLFSMLKDELYASFRAKMGAMLLKPALKQFKGKLDYTEYGGALLLGIDGGVIKAHGSSDARAIKATIMQAKRFGENNVVGNIRQELEKIDFDELGRE